MKQENENTEAGPKPFFKIFFLLVLYDLSFLTSQAMINFCSVA